MPRPGGAKRRPCTPGCTTHTPPLAGSRTARSCCRPAPAPRSTTPGPHPSACPPPPSLPAAALAARIHHHVVGRTPALPRPAALPRSGDQPPRGHRQRRWARACTQFTTQRWDANTTAMGLSRTSSLPVNVRRPGDMTLRAPIRGGARSGMTRAEGAWIAAVADGLGGRPVVLFNRPTCGSLRRLSSGAGAGAGAQPRRGRAQEPDTGRGGYAFWSVVRGSGWAVEPRAMT